MKSTHPTSRKIALFALAAVFGVSILLTIWLRINEPEKTADAKTVVRPKQPITVTQPPPSRESRAVTEAKPDATIAAPVTAATTSTIPLDGCEVVMEAKGTTTKLTGSDGLFDRVMLNANVPVALKVSLPNLTAGKDIIITAPNGGKLSLADGSALRFKAGAKSQELNLIFQPGKSLGAYSVIVMHQGVSQTLDFWVGPQNPVGQPGPPLSTKTTSTN